ncbi:hypothetical protein V2A60_001508 [Cordyceps javanica]|uniref:Nuclear fragile X mental retardation-interacting protein 1 n=1 Tax=Cordyceps javanica TaxID=43265 RepID=A0A545VFB8_9HYPO|nr:nuclear fragile X mental retardation-interacting protein 1 [Cordyceps javanica]TQW11610.1 nuclear fragile X mental retardation-interacting protein 1 [Cordyceps javanica]
MSGYGYGPPPPPPPIPSSSGGFGRGSGLPRRGGSHGRGRGGQGHNHAPRHEQHHASHPRYDYPPQPYTHHTPGAVSYSPAPTPGYPHQLPPQWGHEHAGHHAQAPAPMPPASYPPAYPPQSYPPMHYTPPQQVPYAPPQHYPYGAPPPPNPSQWNGSAPPHHIGGRPPRGGYHDKGPRVTPRPPPASGGYAQPYQSNSHANHPPQHYPYGGPPPPPPAATPRSVSHHKDTQHGQYPRRGRGGHRDGGNRGRGGHHNDRRQTKSNQNPVQHKNESASLGKKKKRKTNTLGLTPGMESESEDDEGEEKALSELIGEEALRINDIAAFLAERRKNYPTKARTEARKAAAQAQRNEDKTASLEKEADKLRKQLRKVESSIKRKREQGDEGDEMRGVSGNSSDDEPPEALSTKASSTTIPSRPLPTAAGKKADITRHCKYYSTGGTCGKKGKCRFVHDPEIREAAIKEREANNGRLTIQQRLILNDKEQEDLTVLRSIQYLRQKGIMSDAMAASAAAFHDSKGNGTSEVAEVREETSVVEKDPGPPLVVSSTSPYQLPPPPASPSHANAREEYSAGSTHGYSNGQVPSNTHSPSSGKADVGTSGPETTKHYDGWLLQPYGSNSKANNVAP